LKKDRKIKENKIKRMEMKKKKKKKKKKKGGQEMV
jgi:hypothetical protein